MGPSCPQPHLDFILHSLLRPPALLTFRALRSLSCALWLLRSVPRARSLPGLQPTRRHPQGPRGPGRFNDIPGVNGPARDSIHWHYFWKAINVSVPFSSGDPGLQWWLPTPPLPKTRVPPSPRGFHASRAECARRAGWAGHVGEKRELLTSLASPQPATRHSVNSPGSTASSQQ